MEIRTVAVVGCGLMGSGIAQVAAGAGYKTIVREVNEGALQAGLGRIRKFLADGVSKGKVAPIRRSFRSAKPSSTIAPFRSRLGSTALEPSFHWKL